MLYKSKATLMIAYSAQQKRFYNVRLAPGRILTKEGHSYVPKLKLNSLEKFCEGAVQLQSDR